MLPVSLIVLALALPGRAAAGPGTQGGQFLRISPSARSASLGATASVSQGGESILMNPSGLAAVRRFEIGLSHTSWFESISYSNISSAFRTGPGVLGIGVNYLAVPDIAKYDNTGTPQNSAYSPSDTAFTLGYGFLPWRAVQFGASAKYISSTIDGVSASALAADAGCQVYFEPAYLQAGLLVQNAGGELKFKDSGDPLPSAIRLGLAFAPPINSEMDGFFGVDQRLLLIAEANYLSDSQTSGNFGMELKRYLDPVNALSFRAGYTSNIRGLGTTGLTVGLGFSNCRIAVDYAFVPYGDLGDTHRITLGYRL